ncbi:MAG: hypothetical protein QXQ24_05550 [Nitrososphaeria archaeon]
MEQIVEIIKMVIGVDKFVRLLAEKLASDYGVTGMSVVRLDDSIALVIKTDKDRIEKLEQDLRESVDMLFGKKVVVRIDGQRRHDIH